jgi:hypothetical protein
MAAPVIAPIAPPINAPEPVLFCEASGFWHPVNPTAEATKAIFTVKTFSFIKNHFIRQQTAFPHSKINWPWPFVKTVSTAASVS